MPPIIANSKGGHGFTDKYLKKNINIRYYLITEMLMCNMKALIFIFKS